MCGIVGYAGPAREGPRGLDVVLEGLARLEYRGYDSAGVAVVAGGQVATQKRAGRLSRLTRALETAPLPEGSAAIGHTRWATHGGPTDANAHPHVSPDGSLAVIHNGIIENYAALRADLAGRGAVFASETDTEVVAHLLEAELAEVVEGQRPQGPDAEERCCAALAAAMRGVCRRLEGSFTLLVVHADAPGVVVGARRNSPLVVGLGEDENYLGSDVAAFISRTKRALELGQDQVVTITADAVEVTDLDGQRVDAVPYTVDWDAEAAEKGGFPWFMAKEIHEQPRAVADTLLGRADADGVMTLDELHVDPSVLRAADKIVVIACGTAAFAGHVAKYAIEHWCRIPVEVELAHEFRYRDPVLTHRTLVVAISQSGETMDLVMAVRHAREQGSTVLAICNTRGSTIPRESDAALYTHAGPEIAVASTKAFLSQVAACYLLGIYLAQLRGNLFPDEVATLVEQLRAVPDAIQSVVDGEEEIAALARELAGAPTVLFLGRHVGYPVALEGALKLKELAYIHAEGFAAGELKHGPIALVEPGVPVFVIVPSPRGRDQLHAKVLSNAAEVRARGARTIAIAEVGDDAVLDHADVVIRVPAVPSLMAPLVTVVPLQIFAMEVATAKGYDVDQPRNLAKSVTVE